MPRRPSNHDDEMGVARRVRFHVPTLFISALLTVGSAFAFLIFAQVPPALIPETARNVASPAINWWTWVLPALGMALGGIGLWSGIKFERRR